MSQTLAGKVALVTGGAKGIGRATALKLASAGCDIAINYYNSHTEAAEVCNQVQSLGRQAIAIQGSVGNPESVKEIFTSFTEKFERLDILISNAASGVLKPVMKMNLKHWRWCMETNALALVLLSQEAAQLMPNGGVLLPYQALEQAGLYLNMDLLAPLKLRLSLLFGALPRRWVNREFGLTP